MADFPSNSSAGDELQALTQFLYRTPVGLIDAEADGLIRLMNPIAAQLLIPIAPGGKLDNLFDVLREVLPDLRRVAAQPAGDRGVLCEGRRIHAARNGSPAPQPVLSLSLFKGEDGRLTAVVHDATQEERRERRRVDRAASTDSLTGLANRHAIHAYLAEQFAGPPRLSRQLGLIFINCDRFQHINDALGHTLGDAVLAELALRLVDAVDASPLPSAETVPAPLEIAVAQQRLVARIGSDEFAVALDVQNGADEALHLAKHLLQVLGQPYRLDGKAVHCPVSVGVACAGPRSHTPGDLLYHARLAMMAAKSAGGNRLMEFDDALQQRAQHRSLLEPDLRRAVAAGELYVVYQPVVSLPDRKVEAVEALVRWRHPVRGIVSPVEFIPIAEEAGLIVDIGAFVLQTACRQFMRWQAQHGPRAPSLMAVNLSRGQLPHPSLVDDVAAVLRETGMRPEQLQLEVTESLAAQDGAVQSRLRELKRLGLTLALDDFGTGYSSLASLYQLPIDLLKIDRSFVSQLETSEHHRVLIEATVRVAQSLNFRTVAEGIETAAQAAFLTKMQCDKGQGYLFSRPLEVDQFDAWLNARE